MDLHNAIDTAITGAGGFATASLVAQIPSDPNFLTHVITAVTQLIIAVGTLYHLFKKPKQP